MVMTSAVWQVFPSSEMRGQRQEIYICEEEQILQRDTQISVNPARSPLRPIRLDKHRRDTPRSSIGVDRGHVSFSCPSCSLLSRVVVDLAES
jgi:hypothetical protein